MLRTTLPLLFVVLLVATAGCLGGGTPVTAPDGGANDGGDATGEAATLAENRTAALVAAGSYTSTWRMRSSEDGRVVGEMRYVTALDYANRRYNHEMAVADGTESRTTLASYHADGRTFQRIGDGDEATYTSSDAGFDAVAASGRTAMVSTVGDLDDFTFVGTETYDGVRVSRYELRDVTPWIAAQAADDAEVRWSDFSYEVLIDDQGLVRSERWQGTGVDDAGVEHAIEFTYELTGVGSTDVAEPGWLAEAAA